jgi:hypothetical protein
LKHKRNGGGCDRIRKQFEEMKTDVAAITETKTKLKGRKEIQENIYMQASLRRKSIIRNYGSTETTMTEVNSQLQLWKRCGINLRIKTPRGRRTEKGRIEFYDLLQISNNWVNISDYVCVET